MRICMITYGVLEFGGLEEFATALAISLKQEGEQVSFLSTSWVPDNNQYVRRLRQGGVSFVCPPRWLSEPASYWPTKEKILAVSMALLFPITVFLGCGIFLVKKRSFKQSIGSAYSWLRGQIMDRIIGPDRRRPLFRMVLSWWKFRWHPDLIHIHGYTNTLLFVIDWAYAHKMPVVYEEQQTPDPQFDWWQGFSKSINKANVVVAVSEKSAETLRSICGVTQPIIVVGPLIPDPFVTGWKKNQRERRVKDGLMVTTFARLYVTKGLQYLLEAISKVKVKHPSTQFKVYGDGELRDELMAYARELGLDGSQIFVGSFTSREDLSRIMANTDIFAMSSILEGQPLSLVEAMAYGCPIVTTTVGGIPELIQDSVNGFLCEPRDSDCLARKLCLMIEEPALREKLGCKARESYELGPFQAKAICNQISSVYRDVITGDHHRTSHVN
jgi:glycosyltransferase involved in cell wall biosynthesis